MKTLELAKKYQEYVVEMRRAIHVNAELSDKEYETIALICSELDKNGIEYTVIENGGVLAKIKGPTDNCRSVLLRADCDALPIDESDDNLAGPRACKSKNPGVMHACGHDAHTAMLLGVAKVLKEKQDEITGTIYLCFERGEEMTENIRYIMAWMDKNNVVIDTAYGIHVAADLPSGVLAVNDTNVNAASIFFDITIEGRGGHGSRPDRSISPINAFAAICMGMDGIRLRCIDPYRPLSYSIGKLNSGSQANIIPDECNFAGTVRMYDRDIGSKFRDEFKKLVEDTCHTYNCIPHFNKLPMPSLAVVNDPECAAFARKVIGDEIGKERIITSQPSMGSESFAHYQQRMPGVFAMLGIKNEAKGTGAAHHNRLFDVDEDVLYLGVAAHVTYALEFLKSSISNVGKRPFGSYREVLEAMGRTKDIEELY